MSRTYDTHGRQFCCGTFTWAYDSFGNRESQVYKGTSGATLYMYNPPTYTFNNATNRPDQLLAPYADLDGNVLYDGYNHYLYDAEGRVCAVENASGQMFEYIYDAFGARISKGTETGTVYTQNGTPTLSCQPWNNGFKVTNNYIYGDNAEQLAEYDGSANLLHENLLLDGKPLATYSKSTAVWTYSLNDWLGTKRVQVAANGSSSDIGFTSLPYGDALSSDSSQSATEGHFTGKDRDPESELDYFGARFYSSSMGRFSSPDPSGLAYAHLFDPQSFNLYRYAQNSPLTNTDPTGLDCVHINNDTGEYEGFESGDCDNSTEALASSGYYVDGTINQISFNNRNQVVGYSGSTGDGQFDSFVDSLSGGGAAFSLNPYSLIGTAPGQSVSVTGNPSAGPDISIANAFSLIAAGKIKPISGPQVSAVPKLTAGQIYNLCALAVTLGAGGNVPGGSPRGTSSLSPSEDTPPINMPVPGKKGLAFVPMNENAAKVESPLAGLALVGSLGDCVNAVSKAN